MARQNQKILIVKENSQALLIETTITRSHDMTIPLTEIVHLQGVPFQGTLTTGQERPTTIETGEAKMGPGFGFLKNRSDSKVQFYQESPEIPVGGRLRFFSGQLEENNKRSVGLISYRRGLQTRIFMSPSPNRHKTNLSPERKFKYFRSRSERLIKKRCNRNGSTSRNKLRFLQHIFPCSQEKRKERKDETCYQSETPKQVSSEDSFQDGHIVKSSQSSKAKRLGDITRSQRCVSTCADIFEAQKVSPFLCKQKVLPIQSSYVLVQHLHQGCLPK